jgi:hypothetical protein
VVVRVKALLGFLLVATGCGEVAVAFLSGDYWPVLPVGICHILGGVILLLWPMRSRRPRMNVERRALLLEQIDSCVQAEDVIAERFARGLIDAQTMLERVWAVRQAKIEAMRELGWRHGADRQQAALDAARSRGTL